MIPINIENATVGYGARTIIDDQSVHVPAGSFFTILGPSGCGKTTFLRLIAGFLTPGQGRVLFGGQDVTHVPTHRRNCGVVFQDYALFPDRTVFENVAYALVSYLVIKRPSILTYFLDYFSLLPLAVAGTVLGIGLINTYHSGWITLTGTWVIMAVAYFMRRVPYAINTTSSAIYSVRDSLEEASISLGVPPLRSAFKVVVPLLRPAMISSAIFMWVTTLSELSATLVLYTPGLETMPIQIYRQIDGGYMGAASAYSLILILSIFVPLFIAVELFKIDVFGTGRR